MCAHLRLTTNRLRSGFRAALHALLVLILGAAEWRIELPAAGSAWQEAIDSLVLPVWLLSPDTYGPDSAAALHSRLQARLDNRSADGVLDLTAAELDDDARHRRTAMFIVASEGALSCSAVPPSAPLVSPLSPPPLLPPLEPPQPPPPSAPPPIAAQQKLCLDVDLRDAFGDGWSGAALEVRPFDVPDESATDTQRLEMTIEDYKQQKSVCLLDGCYALQVEGTDGAVAEASWELLECGGEGTGVVPANLRVQVCLENVSSTTVNGTCRILAGPGAPPMAPPPALPVPLPPPQPALALPALPPVPSTPLQLTGAPYWPPHPGPLPPVFPLPLMSAAAR